MIAFTCADLANLVNVAAIKAAVEGAEKLNSKQLEFAKDRIMMGTERKTMFVTEESKKVSILLGGMNLMHRLSTLLALLCSFSVQDHLPELSSSSHLSSTVMLFIVHKVKVGVC